MQKITGRTITYAMWKIFSNNGEKNPPTRVTLCRAALKEHYLTGRPISDAVRQGALVTGGYVTPLDEINTLTDYVKSGKYTQGA
jgi:hypothetical protein